jgi:hypothetical protein
VYFGRLHRGIGLQYHVVHVRHRPTSGRNRKPANEQANAPNPHPIFWNATHLFLPGWNGVSKLPDSLEMVKDFA